MGEHRHAKMQDIMKKKAPVQATGGAGFRYENAVAARFLLDLLGGTNALGVDFGRIVHIDWQARDAGWYADDLVITCKHASGDRTAAISIKSSQQVTRAGFPEDFVKIAWAQWLGIKTERKLRDSDDALVLVTGSLTHEVKDAWSDFLHDALPTAPERMAARLSPPAAGDGSQSSALRRALFESFTCPQELRGNDDAGNVAAVQLLCRVRLLQLDYDARPSRDHAQALADCQRLLRSGDAAEAERLWSRLIGIADTKRPAGGSIDLPKLLAELRGEFILRGHPDYRRDTEVLERLSQDLMADVRTEIAGLPPLPRVADRATVKTCLDKDRACLLVGESGCGKSALAKEIGQARYPHVIWIAENTLDYDTAAEFERAISISHPLVQVLTALPEPCLFIFDGIERYSARALRLASRFMQDLLSDAGPQHVHVLVTAQFEAADRLIRRFIEFGVPPSLHTATPIGRPSQDDVQALVVSITGLTWASLRPELRPLLTNLKVLDWVVAAARSGTAINDPSFIGLTNLIDALWERWIEGDTDGLGRSRALMHLGVLEGDTLATGVPRMQLEASEQSALGALAASDLVRIRDERVRFSHDLLGDWARMRVLVGEQSFASPASRDRANLPRWHRAVRLYGQRLLEQSADDSEQWQQTIAGLGDDSPTASVIRDLFLESLFLATNAAALLERSWTALCANGGHLLNRMLNRFLFVATLPDPRVAAFAPPEMDSAQFEHLFRVPYWPYWGPLLMVLHDHRADVIRLVPHNAAKICSLWLKEMPRELSPGQPMPWRQEAAELAVAIGREIQALNAEGNYFSDGHDKSAYEAVLWAAPDLPEEVAALCLELAERRDLNPEIQQRVNETHERRREEREQYLAAHPQRKRAPPPMPSWPFGDLRDPWPDGPRARVDTNFQQACLDTGAFSALVRAKPDTALEVLLAVCIEEPQHEDYSNRSMRECGVDHWRDGDPPLFCRGPFLQFLRQAPEQGLSFVLRLVNFATRRYAGDDGLTVITGDDSRTWFGDANVFRWHYDWPLFNGAAIHCSLMALEQWLYEQIDRGENIDPWLARILGESQSLAFAGLLFDVGKRLLSLFSGVLKPFLRNWVLLDLDRQVTTLRQRERGAMGYWGLQPAMMIELGRRWYAMPHRRNLLIFLQGGIVDTMIGDEEHHPFFAELRADWTGKLDAQGEPESLRLLIERFDPANYTFELRDGKRVPVGFEWPQAMARRNEEDLQRIAEHSHVTGLPHRCRARLDAARPLSEEEILWLWPFLQSIESNPPELGSSDGEALLHIEDILCGSIALLVVLHHDWLTADPERMAWCRRRLEAVLEQPPAPFRFDCETASSERKWDAFAAEARVALLARNRDDRLARKLAANGVTAFHYSTTARTLFGACQSRERLGEDFDRMLGLAIRWAGLRTPFSLATRPHFDTQREVWHERKIALIQDFVDQRLPVELPDIRTINAAAADEINAIQAQQFPELARARAAPRRSRRRAGRSRESLHPESLRLDSRVISSAFAWLDLRSAQPSERQKWLGYVRNFLDLTLGSIPRIDDPEHEEIDGLPDHFDDWVFAVVAGAIPSLTGGEDPRSLWQPILDLGSPAHQWVERFFWEWFTHGLRAARSPQDFVRMWADMVEHALTNPGWDRSLNRTYDLDRMVFELLGFNSTINRLGQDLAYGPAVTGMEGVFASAAQRWFAMPRVVTGFLNFVIQPAAAGLLLPGIKWLAAAVPSFDSYDWKYGLEENLIAFLHACWEREHHWIANDPSLRAAFLSLLSCLVARGGHAAIALRDRVVNSATG
jgi:hypothetical protein